MLCQSKVVQLLHNYNRRELYYVPNSMILMVINNLKYNCPCCLQMTTGAVVKVIV